MEKSFKRGSNNITENYDELCYSCQKDKELEEFKPYEPGYVDNFILSSDIEEKVLKDIPSYFSKLQVIYYIYRKLCQYFHYDEQYYATNQRPYNMSKYKDINSLNSIKLGDGVVCNQITVLFAKFCRMFNIPFRIENYESKDSLIYGDEHMLLSMNVDDFIIKADFTTGIVLCDMVTEKIMGRVSGFTLESQDTRKKAAFDTYISEVDDYFDKLKDYEEAKALFKETTQKKFPKLSLRKKLDIFIDIINRIDLNVMDKIYFINKVCKNVFFEEEKANCIFRAISNRDTINENNEAEIIFLIVFNEGVISKDITKNEYYVIDGYKNIKKISGDELLAKFDLGEYDYADDASVLGIEGGKGEERSAGRYKKQSRYIRG